MTLQWEVDEVTREYIANPPKLRRRTTLGWRGAATSSALQQAAGGPPNKEADVHCEALMEDEDLHRHMNRDELEELIAPFVGRFKKCLEEALEKSGKYYFIFIFLIINYTNLGLTNEEIHSVELVGEATRIPICIA